MTYSNTAPQDRPLVEIVARAICGYDIEWRDCEVRCLQANRCAGDIDDRQTLQAQATIDAIEAARFKIVSTDVEDVNVEMEIAGRDVARKNDPSSFAEIFAAMIAASPSLSAG